MKGFIVAFCMMSFIVVGQKDHSMAIGFSASPAISTPLLYNEKGFTSDEFSELTSGYYPSFCIPFNAFITIPIVSKLNLDVGVGVNQLNYQSKVYQSELANENFKVKYTSHHYYFNVPFGITFKAEPRFSIRLGYDLGINVKNIEREITWIDDQRSGTKQVLDGDINKLNHSINGSLLVKVLNTDNFYGELGPTLMYGLSKTYKTNDINTTFYQFGLKLIVGYKIK